MRRIFVFGLAAAVAFAAAPDVSAQAVLVGAGVTVPTGDYADFGDGDGAKAGWMAFGGFTFPLGEGGLSAGIEGFYGSNAHDTDGDKTNLLGGMGLVSFSFGGESAAPFVFGQLGFMKHSYKSDDFPEAEGSESGLAFGGGAGLNFLLGDIPAFIAGNYTMGSGDVDGTTFFGIFVGAQIPVGGG